MNDSKLNYHKPKKTKTKKMSSSSSGSSSYRIMSTIEEEKKWEYKESITNDWPSQHSSSSRKTS